MKKNILFVCLILFISSLAFAETIMVGSAESWSWATPEAGNTVCSGSAEAWTWREIEWGSGRKVPTGSAESWTWADEPTTTTTIARISNHPTLTTNLISYWKLYENALDSHDSVNGTVYGVTFDGTSASFDGSDDYIDSHTVPNASAGAINFWFSAPAQLDTFGVLVGIYTDAEQLRNYISIQASDGQLQMGFDANVEFTGDIVNDSTWRMATMTWGDGTNLARIYLNGALTHTLADDEAHTFILDWLFGNVNVAGSPTADRYFRGNMKDVGYWSRAITTSEITDLYNGGAGLPY